MRAFLLPKDPLNSINTNNRLSRKQEMEFYVVILDYVAVAQWLRCCATNRKVAGSIPDCVFGIFH